MRRRFVGAAGPRSGRRDVFSADRLLSRGRLEGWRRTDPAVRQAAYLYTAAGLIGVGTDLLPPGPAAHPAGDGVDAFNLLIGVLLLTPLSRRISRRASLVFALIAFGNVAMSNVHGAVPPPTLGIWFVLIFIWVGSWHGRGAAALVSPFAAVAYLLPLAFGAPVPQGAVGAVVLVIPVGILAGEAIAANAATARRSADAQQLAVDALAKANVTDDLTGLGNRRMGNQLLDGVRPGDAVAILDLDHFKRVNDTEGHARGDALLQDLGAFLRESLRTGDAVARMGGEEFVLILRQPAPGEALKVVQRLLADWRVLSPVTTLSAGVVIHERDVPPSETYRRADAGLYAAKQAGRDRAMPAAEDVGAGSVSGG